MGILINLYLGVNCLYVMIMKCYINKKPLICVYVFLPFKCPSRVTRPGHSTSELTSGGNTKLSSDIYLVKQTLQISTFIYIYIYIYICIYIYI
jgi:hypothetical protein